MMMQIASTGLTRFGATRRVLLVDDDRIYRHTVAHALQKQVLSTDTLEVIQAPSPEVALALMDQSSFDLIITDNRMPAEDDGIKLIEAIRRGTTHVTTPVMMTSNDTPEEIASKALAAGANAFIPKGMLQELRQAVSRFLMPSS